MPLTVEAVVFDIGETLVDETRIWGRWADWLGVSHLTFFALLGAVLDRGDPPERVFELVRADFDFDRECERRRAAGIPDLFDCADLYSDVEPCLAELHRRGFRVAAAGNQPVGAEAVLRGCGLDLDLVGSSERWATAKPERRFFRRIAAELALPPAAVAYVGDRLDNDVLPARAAGMKAVLLRRGPWGLLHRSRPEAEHADARIDTLTELPAIVTRGRG